MNNIRQNTRYRGFSLIELMVVILIIGILSSIGLPQFKDYTVRAKVMELVTLAQPAKLAVSEALITGGLGIAPQLDNAKLGLDVIKDKDKIKELSVAKSIITIVGNSTALGIDEQKTLKIVLTPQDDNGMITWKCGVEPLDLKKYVPENCRNAVAK
jgi:type IV pilus assembly protein PilA